MEHVELTDIVYSDDLTGGVRVHVYAPNGEYYASDWFTRRIRPREWIELERAAYKLAENMARSAFRSGLEVRITNGSDFCIFHSKGNEVIHPKGRTFNDFWSNLP